MYMENTQSKIEIDLRKVDTILRTILIPLRNSTLAIRLDLKNIMYVRLKTYFLINCY